MRNGAEAPWSVVAIYRVSSQSQESKVQLLAKDLPTSYLDQDLIFIGVGNTLFVEERKLLLQHSS